MDKMYINSKPLTSREYNKMLRRKWSYLRMCARVRKVVTSSFGPLDTILTRK